MLNYNRLTRCLHLAKKINRCLARITAYSGDPYRQCIELEDLCHYADKIKNEFADQELEYKRLEEDLEYINSHKFISSFAKKWGETDEEE